MMLEIEHSRWVSVSPSVDEEEESAQRKRRRPGVERGGSGSSRLAPDTFGCSAEHLNVAKIFIT